MLKLSGELLGGVVVGVEVIVAMVRHLADLGGVWGVLWRYGSLYDPQGCEYLQFWYVRGVGGEFFNMSWVVVVLSWSWWDAGGDLQLVNLFH